MGAYELMEGASLYKTIQPPCGRWKCPLWCLTAPPFRPAGKRVTGFSVAYGSLRIQFPCHRSSVGRQKESALMGRLGAYFAPLGGPMQDLHRGLQPVLTVGRGNAPLLVAGATTFPPAGGLYSSLCVSFILPPLAGEVRRSRIGGVSAEGR